MQPSLDENADSEAFNRKFQDSHFTQIQTNRCLFPGYGNRWLFLRKLVMDQ